jgi:hypothetical protein
MYSLLRYLDSPNTCFVGDVSFVYVALVLTGLLCVDVFLLLELGETKTRMIGRLIFLSLT